MKPTQGQKCYIKLHDTRIYGFYSDDFLPDGSWAWITTRPNDHVYLTPIEDDAVAVDAFPWETADLQHAPSGAERSSR